jgi:hypothetical protein
VDGKIDFVSRMWMDRFAIAAPLNFNAFGQLICPLCARLQAEELLHKMPLSYRYYCARSHFLEAQVQ